MWIHKLAEFWFTFAVLENQNKILLQKYMGLETTEPTNSQFILVKILMSGYLSKVILTTSKMPFQRKSLHILSKKSRGFDYNRIWFVLSWQNLEDKHIQKILPPTFQNKETKKQDSIHVFS